MCAKAVNLQLDTCQRYARSLTPPIPSSRSTGVCARSRKTGARFPVTTRYASSSIWRSTTPAKGRRPIPIRDWKAALTRFTIEFEARPPQPEITSSCYSHRSRRPLVWAEVSHNHGHTASPSSYRFPKPHSSSCRCYGGSDVDAPSPEGYWRLIGFAEVLTKPVECMQLIPKCRQGAAG